MPGVARATTMINALTSVSHQVLICANETIFWMMPNVIAPTTGPTTPPTPPLMAVPPITTAVMELRVIEEPMSALPEPLNIVIAIPESAAINPEMTYVLNCTGTTGTAVSYA